MSESAKVIGENGASRQMAVNVAWAIGSPIALVATMLLLGWLRGSL